MKQNHDSLQKWIDFKSKINMVDEQKMKLLTADELEKIKAQTQVIFPQDYIDFFNVFGEGAMSVNEESQLPSEIRLNIPNVEWSKQNVIWFKNSVRGRNQVFRGRFDTEAQHQLQLLDNCFVFCDSSRAEIFIWDLRTYKVEDDSYDIYQTNIDSFSSDYVGRNFYEFICNFSFRIDLLQVLSPRQDFNPNPTFTCIDYELSTFTCIDRELSLEELFSDISANLSHIIGKIAQQRQKAIDRIIKEDFSNLRLTYKPQYNPFMRTVITKPGKETQLGKNSFSSRSELRDTIIHDELHHRWWKRGIADHHPIGSGEKSKFYETIRRYKRMRGWN
jgi:hypothetical protein